MGARKQGSPEVDLEQVALCEETAEVCQVCPVALNCSHF